MRKLLLLGLIFNLELNALGGIKRNIAKHGFEIQSGVGYSGYIIKTTMNEYKGGADSIGPLKIPLFLSYVYRANDNVMVKFGLYTPLYTYGKAVDGPLKNSLNQFKEIGNFNISENFTLAGTLGFVIHEQSEKNLSVGAKILFGYSNRTNNIRIDINGIEYADSAVYRRYFLGFFSEFIFHRKKNFDFYISSGINFFPSRTHKFKFHQDITIDCTHHIFDCLLSAGIIIKIDLTK